MIELRLGDIIFAFPFGKGRLGKIHKSNQGLAKIVEDVLQEKEVPVFAGFEIGKELESLDVKVDFQAREYSYKNTTVDDVLTQFVSQVKKMGLIKQRIILIAQIDSCLRLQILLRKMLPNFEVVLGPTEPSNYWSSYGCDKYGFHPDSEIVYTRNRNLFRDYESMQLNKLKLEKL